MPRGDAVEAAVAKIAWRYRVFVDIFEKAAASVVAGLTEFDRDIAPQERISTCNWE